jgi:nucleotide-binding universal stress UspA family protein
MHRFRNVAVGLSRGPADAALIRYAAMICRWGAVQSVRFLHVLPRGEEGAAEAPDSPIQAELQAAVAAHFTEVPSGVRSSCTVVAGPLLDRFLASLAEEQMDVLLIGYDLGSSGWRPLARRLAMKAPCSVWMIPERADPQVRKILVPIDFSESAADAMQVAVSMARSCGASCVALHVYFNEAVVTYEEYDQVIRGQEAEAYQRFIAPIDCHGVEVKRAFEEGANAADVIARVAQREGADLIVAATRGRSRSAAILLGSVTEEMIMTMQVPLLAVKHFGARMSVLQALLDRRFLFSRGLHTD